jgi:hypothetical protein
MFVVFHVSLDGRQVRTGTERADGRIAVLEGRINLGMGRLLRVDGESRLDLERQVRTSVGRVLSTGQRWPSLQPIPYPLPRKNPCGDWHGT